MAMFWARHYKLRERYRRVYAEQGVPDMGRVYMFGRLIAVGCQ